MELKLKKPIASNASDMDENDIRKWNSNSRNPSPATQAIWMKTTSVNGTQTQETHRQQRKRYG